MKLIFPSKKYLSSYLEALKEYADNKVDTYRFFDAANCDIFKKFDDYKMGNNLPKGYVKATYFWLVDKRDFVGEISIRHELTPDLLRFGGNIGYGVRFSKWNLGYGALMLKMALSYAKREIGLDKVLITCNDDNLASARVIEKNGGILQDKIFNSLPDGDRITRRYWIDLRNF